MFFARNTSLSTWSGLSAALFIHGVTCGGEHTFGAHKRAWHTQGFARQCWEKWVFVAARVSPPMQRVAVSGDDLGSQFTAQAGRI